MDYEKKYKEALELARQLKDEYNDIEGCYPNQWICEKLFPELAETKDEKIKKAIIATIHLYYGEPLEDEAREMITWLEKQKEQRPQIKLVFPKFRVGDIIQHIPFEKWDTTKKITYIDETGYHFDLSHQGDTVSGGCIGFSFEKDYELVDQKTTEWSEENEEIINNLIDYLENELDSSYTDLDKESFAKEIKLLKSLRPQSQWKPSKKQLETLKFVCNNHIFSNDSHRREMESLLKQLKAL